MAALKIGGTAYMKIDGVQYALRGKFSYSPFSVSKEGVVGSDGVHGYTEKPVIPSVKFQFSDLGGISVSQLQNLTDSTVTAELVNGKIIILRDAWVKGQVEVNTEDGSYDGEMEGLSMVEQTSN